MSIFNTGKVCLFSKISGVVTYQGKPAANALLIRTVNLSRDKIDKTWTDENGYFEMPAVFVRTITKLLPQEFAAQQVIDVDFDGEQYNIWSGVKRIPEENAEARGESLVVRCELTQERTLKQVNSGPIFSRCIWGAEPDSSNAHIWSSFDYE
jgi:hypothetical protein